MTYDRIRAFFKGVIISSTLGCCTALVSACATPNVTLLNSEAHHDGFPASLPAARLDLTETRTVANNEATLEFHLDLTISDSATQFTVVPERAQWRETVLAPTYFENTSVIKSLAVQTIDRRAAFASAIVSVAARLGIDLTTGDVNEAALRHSPACNLHLLQADVQALAERTLTAGQTERLGSTPCDVRIRQIGPLPVDAMTLEAFRATYQGRRVGVVPYAACREIVLDVANANFGSAPQRMTISIPDTRYVRRQPLPYHATLSFEHVCSAPDITDAQAPEHSDLEVLSDILNAFKNPSH